MKKLKLLAAALAALTGCAVFAGCQNKGPRVNTGSPDKMNIVVIAKGYGHQYAIDLAEAYNATNPEIEAQFAFKSPEETFVLTSFSAGLEGNNTDIYFSLNNPVFSTLARPDYGAVPAWADLSDVYNAPAQGYAESDGTVTYGQLMDPYFKDAMTQPDSYNAEYAGKQFVVPWSSGFWGFLYNATLWNKANQNLTDAGKPAMELPKTSKEMFSLFDRIKSESVIYNTVIPGSGVAKKYAFSYSGVDNYVDVAMNNWWPQYDGLDKANAFFKGQDENGAYTWKIYDTEGRLRSYEGMAELIRKTNGYVNDLDFSTAFKTTQLDFLKGRAFFSFNGDWLENEVSNEFTPGSVDVRYMRAPVISDIVNSPKAKALFDGLATPALKDARLREVLDYIDECADGNAAAVKPAYLAGFDSQFNHLKDARLVQSCALNYVAMVPWYSAKKEAAKDFLKFMLSKEGQEVFMNATYGARPPLKVDIKQFDYYEKATEMGRSKLNILNDCKPFAFNIVQYPIFFLSDAAAIMGNGSNVAAAFGCSTNKVVSAAAYFNAELATMQMKWDGMMSNAGLK